MALEPRALAEARSIAMHRAIVSRLRDAPELLEDVRARLAAWSIEQRPYARAWSELVDGDRERLFAAMVDPSEAARARRQSTPFAGLLDPRTRWRIHAAVRAESDHLAQQRELEARLDATEIDDELSVLVRARIVRAFTST
jgi:hypothetical protein